MIDNYIASSFSPVSKNRLRRLLAPMAGILRLERHALGPRVYVLGQRVHECAVGMALLGLAPLGRLDDFSHPRAAMSLAGTGLWLLIKDWHDLIPARRNTRAWSPLIHRCRQQAR